MSSSTTPNFDDHEDRSRREKRRRIDSANLSRSTENTANTNQIRWRSAAEQHTYSSKLLEALQQVRRRDSPAPAPSGSRAVREAADKVLAIAARGRTRWSRAILANRLKLRLKNHKKAKVRPKLPAPVTGTGRSIVGERQQALPPIEKRVKVLGRLVPGCRKLSFPNLLEEATDYIAALQMQVRAMAALADLLTGSAAGSSESSSSSRNPVPMS